MLLVDSIGSPTTCNHLEPRLTMVYLLVLHTGTLSESRADQNLERIIISSSFETNRIWLRKCFAKTPVQCSQWRRLRTKRMR
jgi:hypothetical protein